MRQIYTSNNPVELAWLEVVLSDAGIPALIMDQHMSIVEGSIGAIPRRIMVPDEDEVAARRLVKQALAKNAEEVLMPTEIADESGAG